jgi:RimJ/RimL family protein N-acetyltransferase
VALSEVVRRPVTGSDMQIAYLWRSEHTESRFQQSTLPISWDTHKAWFEKRVKDSISEPFVAYESEGVVVAFCRLDEVEGLWRLSLTVSPAFRNKGVGYQVLKDFLTLTRDELGLSVLHAVIHKDNIPSLKLFQSLGFLPEGASDDDFTIYALRE